MSVIYSPEVRQVTDGMPLLEKASSLLSEVLGKWPSEQVKADWQRVEDFQGRAIYRLTLRDFTGEASTDFAPDELENPLHMKFRMYRLWGDLLQVRSDQQWLKVSEMIGQLTPN